MAQQRNELHANAVELWKAKNPCASSVEYTQLLQNGITAIWQCCLSTLSNVTVTAVSERILHECRDKYPFLSEIKIDPKGIHFDGFSDPSLDFTEKDVHRALEEFLIELLDVFGKITAEIITKKLHQRLMNVTSQSPPKKNIAPPAALSLGLAKKNRDQK